MTDRLYLERLGFQAVATTSAGRACTRGLPDGAVGRDDMIAHFREIVASTSAPVNADVEDAWGAFLAAARALLECGTFERFAAAEGYAAMNSAWSGGR